jgi:Coatomer epsilon subunit
MLNIIYMALRGALLIQLYIRIDRLDLAEKHLKVMKSADEDSTLSMLASAWIGLSSVSATSMYYRISSHFLSSILQYYCIDTFILGVDCVAACVCEFFLLHSDLGLLYLCYRQYAVCDAQTAVI